MGNETGSPSSLKLGCAFFTRGELHPIRVQAD
jgi:hypothetical protein